MSKVIIPVTNPVKHVEMELAEGELVKLFDRYNYQHTVQKFEGYLPYSQKWISGIPIRYQIWLQDVESCSIDLVNCLGTFIANFPIDIKMSNYLVGTESYEIGQINIDSSLINVDKFYLILKYRATGSMIEYYRISEPQEIVSSQDPMLVLNYKNSFNEWNTIYKTSFNDYFEQDFNICVEGRIKYDKPGNNRQTYEDQKLDLTLLSSKPFDVFRFFFGSGKGIPDWMASLLNIVISHNSIFTGRYKFTFSEELNKKDAGYYSRYLYEVAARFSEITYATTITIPEGPSIEGGFALPDASEAIPYNFIQNISGDTPFTLSAVVKPGWMTITINGSRVIFGGTPAAPDVSAGVNISFDVSNSVGSLNLTDLIDVLSAPTCIPANFPSIQIVPNGTVGIPYDYTILVDGTAPFVISNVEKPAWLTLTPVANGIRLTGNPVAVSLPVALSFTISNCSGGPSNSIDFVQAIAVNSGISVIGNTYLNISNPVGSGYIAATPGTLVSVTISALGPVGNTYNLIMSIFGGIVTGATNVTNGTQVFTVIIPASGSVGWSATFTGTGSGGVGTIQVT